MARRLRIHAETLHDGSPASPQQGRVVEIAGDRIVAVGAGTVADADLSFPVVAPGFIDLQINGGGGVLFNDSPDPATLDRIAGAARRGGAAHVLPTFITAPDDAYLAAIRAVAEATASGMPGILGLHLEGPFLSPDRPGIHDRTAIRPLTHADVELLGAPRPFPLLVTLAPERQPAGQLDRLAAAGVILFAGHTEAPAALVATSRALSGVTHLFNAMPPISARAPGPAGAALVSDRLYAGIIADGHHVDPHNLALAARLMQDRLILVSDAMPTVGHDSTGFTLAGRRIALQGGRLTAEDGTLAGAHLTLDRAVRTMVAQASVPVGLALRMVSGVPARVLGLERELGRIAPGYRASLTCLSQDLRTIRVIVDGHPHDG